jgi:hypothetical protein
VSTPQPAQQLTFCLWDTAVERQADGSVKLRPRAPMSVMSAKRAGEILGLGVDRIYDLYQAGLIEGCKPGAMAVRKDGRRSNAALRLDSASVLEYKERQRENARRERDLG